MLMADMLPDPWLRTLIGQIHDRLESMEERQIRMEKAVAGLRARAQMWGFLAGIVPGLVAAVAGVVMFWRK